MPSVSERDDFWPTVTCVGILLAVVQQPRMILSFAQGETLAWQILTSQLSCKLLISSCNLRFMESEWDMHF